MTIDQYTAVWELKRKGLHDLAYRAQQCWEQGKSVRRDNLPRAARLLRDLIERCNRELETSPAKS